MHRVVISEMICWEIASVICKTFSSVITREICVVRQFHSSELLVYISAINRGLEATLLDLYFWPLIFFNNNHLWKGEIDFSSEHTAVVKRESPERKRCVWKRSIDQKLELFWRFMSSGMLLPERKRCVWKRSIDQKLELFWRFMSSGMLLPERKRCVWKRSIDQKLKLFWRFMSSGMLLMPTGKLLFAFEKRSRKSCSAGTDWHFRRRKCDAPKHL
jgi:hypothetical protein